MNPERLKKLQATAAQVRIGGKGEYSASGVSAQNIFVVIFVE